MSWQAIRKGKCRVKRRAARTFTYFARLFARLFARS